MPDSSVKLSDKLSDQESHHLVHSDNLRRLNLGHGFAVSGVGVGPLARLRRFFGKLFLGSYFDEQHQFNVQLVQYLNQLTAHLDVELGDRSRNEISLLGKKIARSSEDLELLGLEVAELCAEGPNGLNSRVQSIESNAQLNAARIETLEAVASGMEQILRGLSAQKG